MLKARVNDRQKHSLTTMKTALFTNILFCLSFRPAGAFLSHPAGAAAIATATKPAVTGRIGVAAALWLREDSRCSKDDGGGPVEEAAARSINSSTRRSAVKRVGLSTCAGALSLLFVEMNQTPLQQQLSRAAWASGGATAGGAYLLSAKQRYNERVKAGVAGFLALETSLENNDLDALRSYFSGSGDDTPAVGTWKDLTTAGYLLANAFRRNSSAAPDTLPAVQVRFVHPFPVCGCALV
jgi:hypothetical protein